jgi:hypothetical protein
VPVSTLERDPVVVGSAQDILERLERYAATHRPPRVIPDAAPVTAPAHRFDPATVDLFPYDLAAAIIGCAATILASVAFARPLALLFVGGLAVASEWSRRTRWFPGVGTNLLLGTAIGLVLVLTA